MKLMIVIAVRAPISRIASVIAAVSLSAVIFSCLVSLYSFWSIFVVFCKCMLFFLKSVYYGKRKYE